MHNQETVCKVLLRQCVYIRLSGRPPLDRVIDNFFAPGSCMVYITSLYHLNEYTAGTGTPF